MADMDIRDALIGPANVSRDARDLILVLSMALDRQEDGLSAEEVNALWQITGQAKEKIDDVIARIAKAAEIAEVRL